VVSAPRRQRGAGRSYLGVFGECERIFDVYSEIANRVLNRTPPVKAALPGLAGAAT